MKTVVFAYDFEHWKTQATLTNLFLRGFKPDAVIAAPYRELKVGRSAYAVTPTGRYGLHPNAIATRFDIPYHICSHDSQECLDILGAGDFDVGIVAGARILKADVIAQLRHGILNMHPGALPACRGLDTLKWSIEKDLPLAVTLHFIDEYVDKGSLVLSDSVFVHMNDSIVDVGLRMQHAEQKLLLTCLPRIFSGETSQQDCEAIGDGNRFGIMPWSIEKDLKIKFLHYKSRRGGGLAR